MTNPKNTNFILCKTFCSCLVGELEKCLEELEMKTDTTQQLSTVYDKVESERNQLLEELDIAFQDLQEYMRRQVGIWWPMKLTSFNRVQNWNKIRGRASKSCHSWFTFSSKVRYFKDQDSSIFWGHCLF